jgi:hypothetical protein
LARKKEEDERKEKFIDAVRFKKQNATKREFVMAV